MTSQPILSICIPTWNRAVFLDTSLASFKKQIDDINAEDIELFISDNCSEDNTSSIVKKYIDEGMPITYNRNDENIGAARNFLKCMEWASGKYILLLGDDDILNPGSLNLIVDSLKGNDYGVAFIHKFDNVEEEIKEYNDLESFYKQISYWFTFMSGCIFLKEVVPQIEWQKYVNTHLLQMPYYIASASLRKNNLLINKPIIQEGLDKSSNGGYNFYEVFVQNYLNIWHEFVDKKILSKSCFRFIKKDIYVNFIDRTFNYRLLVKHVDVKDETEAYKGNRKGFKIKGANQVLLKYYGNSGYFYLSMMKMHIRKYVAKVYHLFK